MKKIIFGLAILVASIAPKAWAGGNQVQLLTNAFIAEIPKDSGDYKVKIICADGYKFLLAWKDDSRTTISVVQMYRQSIPLGRPQPITCEER